MRHIYARSPAPLRPPRSLRVLSFVTDATNHVGRHGLVDLLRVRQAKVGHDQRKLIYSLRETKVIHLLLPYGAAVSPLEFVTARVADKGQERARSDTIYFARLIKGKSHPRIIQSVLFF